MKKTLFVISVITIIAFTGCSKADIEKNPVVIADAASLDDKVNSEASKDIPTKEETTKTPEATGSDEEAKEDTQNDKKNDSQEETKDTNGAETDNSSAAVKPTPVTIEIEGMKETINGLWHKGDGYEMLYDSDKFKYSEKDGADTFLAENPDPAIYPYVYVSINHIENKSASDYVKELSDTLSKNNLKSEITKDVSIGSYEGTIVTAIGGTEWNSIIRNYYILENGTSVYTIESQYFVEAAEGYGARINAMINTFEIK